MRIFDEKMAEMPDHNFAAKLNRQMASYEGSSVSHFITEALRLQRPALRDPVRYWATEHARAQYEGVAGRDPFTQHYFRWLQNQ